MKALLDTNIVIHREANHVLNRDIGTLFGWLDKGKYTKCIHPITIEELKKNSNKETIDTLAVKLDSYQAIKTIAPQDAKIKDLCAGVDLTFNDKNDTVLLNEVYCSRVDIFITEDKKIHAKAALLGIPDKVFTIDSFLEKVVSEHPELVNYKVLSVTKKHFGEINLKDAFFDSFREDYPGFNDWFNKKSDEIAYITSNEVGILSFRFLKVEDNDENYSNILPIFPPAKRLKIGTFKVVSNGLRLGERFLKIVFDNALQNKVSEIYVTIFDKREDQIRLIRLLEEWGFTKYGKKKSAAGEELVFVKSLKPVFDRNNPKLTYPFISRNVKIFIAPIWPQYHTELLPDSILKTESPVGFVENKPHRNAISKVYISRSIGRNINKGDIIIFYRTAEKDKHAYFNSVITTIGLIESKVENIADEYDFVLKCRKRSVFSDDELKRHWNWSQNYRPFILNFLYLGSFVVGKRLNRKRLLDLKILSGENNELRGLKQITPEQFNLILKETNTDESIIVD